MPADPPFVIRRATEGDAPALGRLGALLMRVHYGFDPQRFLPPGSNPEAGYGRFLRSQLRDDEVVVFVQGHAIRVKRAPGRAKPEHDDAAAAAKALGLPLREVLAQAAQLGLDGQDPIDEYRVAWAED